jgi:hypothetical protein
LLGALLVTASLGLIVLAVPTGVIAPCRQNDRVYQTATVTLGEPHESFRGQIDMHETCINGIYRHNMRIYTTQKWELFGWESPPPPQGPVFAHLYIGLPSWNKVSLDSSWSNQFCMSPSKEGGGVGYTFTQWSAGIVPPCYYGSADMLYLATNSWSSFGGTYDVTVTIHDSDWGGSDSAIYSMRS